MKTDYDYYLLGCRYREVPPLSRWRFTVAYAKYRQWQRLEIDQMASPKRQSRIARRWYLLKYVADLVAEGQDIAARAGRFEDGEDGTTGAGDREPRTPRTPVLCGCGARSLPYPDPNSYVERQL